MKVLFDHNVPKYLLPVFGDATTAYRQGWHGLVNGKLLDAAEKAGFELLITLDGGFLEQQNLVGRSIAVAVLEPRGQSREAMFAVGELLVGKVNGIKPGTVERFSMD